MKHTPPTVDQVKANFNAFAERFGMEHVGHFEHPGQESLVDGWFLEQDLSKPAKRKFRMVEIRNGKRKYLFGEDWLSAHEAYTMFDMEMNKLDGVTGQEDK